MQETTKNCARESEMPLLAESLREGKASKITEKDAILNMQSQTMIFSYQEISYQLISTSAMLENIISNIKYQLISISLTPLSGAAQNCA